MHNWNDLQGTESRKFQAFCYISIGYSLWSYYSKFCVSIKQSLFPKSRGRVLLHTEFRWKTMFEDYCGLQQFSAHRKYPKSHISVYTVGYMCVSAGQYNYVCPCLRTCPLNKYDYIFEQSVQHKAKLVLPSCSVLQNSAQAQLTKITDSVSKSCTKIVNTLSIVKLSTDTSKT